MPLTVSFGFIQGSVWRWSD